jgi:integrase
MTVEDVGRIGFGVYVGAFKRSPARFVFLPDEGMAFFLSQCEGKAERDLLFRTDTGKVWKKHHTTLFRRAVSEAELPKDLVFHGLRHTYASDLVRSGVPLDMVARQLGHSNTRTVIETYGHFAEHHREQLIRHCFSSLSANNKALSKQMRPRLDELWQTVQRKEWRDYAHIPETCPTPLR